jgi:hypothetical protein
MAYQDTVEPGAFSLMKVSGGDVVGGQTIEEDLQKGMARKVLSMVCFVK